MAEARIISKGNIYDLIFVEGIGVVKITKNLKRNYAPRQRKFFEKYLKGKRVGEVVKINESDVELLKKWKKRQYDRDYLVEDKEE